MRRFPFDEQTCSIELVFSEYESKEVEWHIDTEKSGEEPVVNPSWKIRNTSSQLVPKHKMNKVGDLLNYVSKSIFQYNITLKRQPRTAVVYVILPTMAIALFNMISLLLPTGEGIARRRGKRNIGNSSLNF